VVSPNDADSVLAVGFLVAEGVDAFACASLEEALPLVGPGLGCLVAVEEAFLVGGLEQLDAALRAQPAWSDLPLVLIATHDSSLAAMAENVFPQAGNVTALQRPLHPVSLVSAVSVALRARRRQYEVRDLLEERTRALKHRDEFLAMLAHELRNPLAPIRNAVYLMQAMQVPDPNFAKYRGMIEKQTRHITRLVDDLLDASRLELGKMDLRRQAIDLNPMVVSAVESCMAVTSVRGHRVETRLAPRALPIDADPVRIEQILGNLITNAAKYTADGGSIVIETAREGGFAVVRVRDDGQGIRPELLDSVFELFVQDDRSLARTAGGLGIGLTLVKRLVELHGGRIHAQSPGPGLGSTFEACFPLREQEPPAPGAAAERAQASSPRKVLIVEDGVETRESLGLLVGLWGHRVTYASDGPAGLAVALETRPDVALVDIGLPRLDGYEVARRIRSGPLPWSRRVKLVALTGYGRAGDRDRALEAGFDDHLLKPVDPDVLEKILAHA